MTRKVTAAKRAALESKVKAVRWFALVGVLILIGLVVLSALSIIYCKDLTRRSFSELQQLHQTRDQLQVVWSQLLLEQSTWTTQSRIQRLAEKRLDMVIPPAKTITMLTLDR